jgi:hydroxyacylglutathione hydrolase
MQGSIIYRDPNITVFQSALYQMNSVVVHTQDAVLVFDPGLLPDEVRAIQHLVLEKRRDKPLYLVFTHSDFDHIMAWKAFGPTRTFMTERMALSTRKEAIVQEMKHFDEQYYIERPYPLVFPEGDFLVYRDEVQFRVGQTKMSIYLTPGHTDDSMMIVVWQLGLLMAGDYLSDLEFPIITDSSVAYEASLIKLNLMHDRNWFTRVVPGHGSMAFDLNTWVRRQQMGLAYIYAMRESISTGLPFDTEGLFERYPRRHALEAYHRANEDLMRREYEAGMWVWEPDLLQGVAAGMQETREDQDEGE